MFVLPRAHVFEHGPIVIQKGCARAPGGQEFVACPFTTWDETRGSGAGQQQRPTASMCC